MIDKPGKGAFFATDLQAILTNRGIENLIVGGVTTEVCVHTTVREANDRGYRCIVAGDCCGSYFPEFHEVGLRMIKAQGGIFGWVSDSKRILSAFAAERGSDKHDDQRRRPTAKPKLWVPGDWNAFFGFGTNILVNLMVLTTLLRFVIKMPDSSCSGASCPRRG